MGTKYCTIISCYRVANVKRGIRVLLAQHPESQAPNLSRTVAASVHPIRSNTPTSLVAAQVFNLHRSTTDGTSGNLRTSSKT